MFEKVNKCYVKHFVSWCNDFQIDYVSKLESIGVIFTENKIESIQSYLTVEKLLYLINSVTYWEIKIGDDDWFEVWIDDLEITFIDMELEGALFNAFQELFLRDYY